MEQVILAKIVKPQGIKGDVKVILFADADFDMQSIKYAYIDGNKTLIEKCYMAGGNYVLKFDIISDVQMANLFRGKEILIDKDQIKLEKGQYLIADLVGKIAKTTKGKEIGEIYDIQNFGSADVIYIQGKKEVLCSHVAGLIKGVDDKYVVFDAQIFEGVAVYED